MESKSRGRQISYLTLVLLHVAIGVVVFLLPVLAKIFALLILAIGFFIVVKTKNKNNEALYVAAYLTGVEVFLRMTEGNFIEQYAKFGIIGVLLLGILFTGVTKPATPYIVFLIFLIPGIILGVFTLNFDTDIRKAITFNIIGPLTLAFSAIYCYGRRISLKEMVNIIHSASFPIICIVVYLFLYTPNIKEVVTNTESNFATSGGYGPNQMSTILGLGIFLFFTKLVLFSDSKKNKIIDVILLIVIVFRGIVTFSRGGVIAGGVMILVLMTILFLNTKTKAKMTILKFVFLMSFILVGIWTYSSIQTGGLIDKRYANQDARGRVKASKLTGREKLIESEFKMFMDNPILGIGVGKNREYRQETTGIEAASHNEISRMLAEHGMFGIFDLLILFFTPLFLAFNNRMNVFVIPFVIFWLLTINHAAMRIAAPAFIYALSLLKVYTIEKPALHREQAVGEGA
ncbi:O-antigen ligase family protein [Flavobacterium amniphilum]|uniref:O-antigen ligase family protein n=1 Tax=Flavobacterium amniphilum TaxID=1834035 RepID=UPI00202A4C0F|nr:O-antigen ligase family protein [Flavobacterium amniphilum]MCL9805092.1 O-antigen ligase family protein [Flavobacterium amniphilum]